MRKQTYKTQIVLILTVTVIGLLLPLVAQAGALGAPREGTPQTGQSISRRADGSSSGPSRRYRARTPVPLEDGDGEEPIPRLGSGGSPITVNIETSRTSGVAPLAVFFDVVGDIESPNLTWDEIESHEFVWDFGDGTEADTSSGGRYFSGYMAAHVYETPDTYTVTLTVKQDGQVVATDTEVITVSSFTGRTLCVSPSSDFADCPSSSSSDHFTDFNTAWNQITTNSRLLLHRGESWTRSSSLPVIVPGPVIIGAYGDPSLPKPHIGFSFPSGFPFSITQEDWRFTELDISSTSGGSVYSLGSHHFLSLRNDLNDIANGYSSDPAGYNSIYRFIVDGTVTNAPHTNYLGGAGTVILNSKLVLNSDNGAHTIRIGGGRKVLIAGNDLTSYGGHTVLTIRAASSHDRPSTDYVLVSNNTITQTSGWGIATGGSGSATQTETVNKVIIEKNRGEDLDIVLRTGNDVSIRNNVFVYEVETGGESFAIAIDAFRSVPYPLPFPKSISVYNNTYYTTRIAHNAFLKLGIIDDDIKAYNNIMFAPNANIGSEALAVPVDKVTSGAFRSNNNIWYLPQNNELVVFIGQSPWRLTLAEWQSQYGQDLQSSTLDPEFISTDPANPDFLKLSSVSPAIDAGAMVLVPDDYVGTSRPIDGPDPDTIPQWDIGAYEYGLLTLIGDFDEDGDVDMDDYAMFEEAYTGANRPVAPGYEYADLDGDGDVDLDDFAIFAANYTG